ncbi:hypothetical protein P9597_02600 [Aneurinibacillus migulanus]|uniref:hypothetical protein n=1 Tax=Aneurinibacillus migulanus TaxID=47500 RepID=UPI002E1C56A8|nr:hypothetical protein [Aneurinibacillus migulanus]
MKKKTLLLTGLVAISLALSGCGGQTTNGVSQENKQQATPLTPQEFQQMFGDPAKFKGRKVDYYAKIFTNVEKNEKGAYLQAWADPKNSEKNTVIGIKDPNLDVKQDDYIHVVGIIKDKFSGENAFGKEVTAPLIEAEKVEKVDYATAMAPAIKTIIVNQEKEQHGYVMKIEKIELSEEETRLYVKVTNKSKHKIMFYDFNSKILQGSNQIETQDNFEANYKKPQSEILPGVTTDGVVTFKKIDPSASEIKFISEPSSENYEIQMKPFEFVIKNQ